MAYKVLLDAFPDVEAFMVCTANFKLTKEFAIAGSDDAIKFALGGVVDATQILPLCLQATDKAARKFEAWFSKEMQE